VLDFLTAHLPNLLAGSADLTESVLTKTTHSKSIKPTDFTGNYLHYGVREHAMAAVMNGLALHSNFIPYAGTFLVFADYCKPAIRLSALMKQQVFYILTHDSIGLGEDGPTHQPIEQLAMLRSIPNLLVFRPCDLAETIASYELALKATDSPSAFILSRQNLPAIAKANQNYQQGAYVVAENTSNSQSKQVLIFASGSEVQIAMTVFEALKQRNIACKVVSVLCFELFKKQNEQYQQQILLNHQAQVLRVAIEAGSSFGWHQFIGIDGIFVGIDSFGASAKASDLFTYFNITATSTLQQILAKL
jgi:transketolase